MAVVSKIVHKSVAYLGIFFGRGSTNSVGIEDRENGDLGAVAP